ncbi:MAG: Fe-S protein assembly co-chaperone HscB [Alysiella sp.]|uniref:Fe-S protein assembly co-chaperone HscB n=1 Tax=Alysiella sp. TaxID=1872483 RepID=UPI0026DC39DD|nr:Fe-S protein assembly co-chaperone HscB [Alysiella sp.]MDO4433493.1 Fe-S protein assembly co-chaperone HscB [Alysiella sp.]
MMNPFTLFHLPEQFDLDIETLTQNYRTLVARFHPDNTAAASPFEKKQSLMMTATLNQAYHILQNPLNRAAYLLQQQGIHADAPEHTQFAPNFLIQQMMWREQLNDAKLAHDEVALNALRTEISAEQTQLHNQLAQTLNEKQYEQAANLVRQGRFLDKILQEIQAA